MLLSLVVKLTTQYLILYLVLCNILCLLQNATECLAAFVLGGKEELLAWGGHSGLIMKSLLNAASR